MDEDSVIELIGLVYDAAADPRLWPAFLKRLSEIAGGNSEIGDEGPESEHVFLTTGGTALASQRVQAMLTTSGPVSSVPLSSAVGPLRAILLPHLKRALHWQATLTVVEGYKQASQEALERLAIGVVLIDQQGRVVWANRRANAIFECGDGLSADADGIRASDCRQSVRLRHLIRAALTSSAGTRGRTGGALGVARRSGGRDYSVLVCPLSPRAASPTPSQPALMVFITDPDRPIDCPPDYLQRLYALTSAEARLLPLLLHGSGLPEAADRLGISRHTAHSQLSAIFRKTGTRRQSELVRVVMTTLASFQP
jgi:DNA-binding CsgD family transcriptional regulator